MMFDEFGSPFRVPGGALLGLFWHTFYDMDLFELIFGGFLKEPDKGVKTELPKGGWICNPLMPVHAS